MKFPLHSAIVHYPIALFIFAFIMQAIYLLRSSWVCRKCSIWLLGFGVLTSIGAMISGQFDAKNIEIYNYKSSAINAIQKHELIASVTIWSSLIIFIGWLYLYFRYPEDKRIDILVLFFLALLSSFVLITSYLGGQLVYIHHLGLQ